MGKAKEICSGSIDTSLIYDTHTKIKELVTSYKDINLEVSSITNTLLDNWVGVGRNEFESQYKILISKITDFGDGLQEIYDALVDAEASYETVDDKIRKELVKATGK